jgi:polysaccharide pyruvyl transferase WcaK-like protein
MSDRLLQLWTSRTIERTRRDHQRGQTVDWRPGQPLRLLFAGYNGARNTGSDVRVEEMLRQVRTVLGDGNVDLSVLTQDFRLTSGYFGDAVQVKLPDIFPPFLGREVPRHHGVIACEGSMFKSRFADALTTMMIGTLGIASARNGLSVGYGAEAGEMSRPLQRMVRKYCGTSLVITRNEESERILRRLQVPVEPGTDTAWTFEPHGPEYGERVLQEHGWDGTKRVLGICPINPFWWPVRPSLPKAVARFTTGAFRDAHYRSLYFHRSGPAVDRAYHGYLDAIAGAVRDFRSRRDVFPVLIAMEQLDARACRALSERLGGVPVFTSADYDMYELVSILRKCSLLVSSRFHAIVTSMPGLVPSAGITMDERIRNLLHDRGHEDLLMNVDDADLEERLADVLEVLWSDADAIRPGIARSVVRNLKLMARMGHFLEAEVSRRFPDFPVRSGVVGWREYLPPLSPALRKLLAQWDEDGSEEAAPRPAGHAAREIPAS